MPPTIHDWSDQRPRSDGAVWRYCKRCEVAWIKPEFGRAYFERRGVRVKREDIATCEVKS